MRLLGPMIQTHSEKRQKKKKNPTFINLELTFTIDVCT